MRLKRLGKDFCLINMISEDRSSLNKAVRKSVSVFPFVINRTDARVEKILTGRYERKLILNPSNSIETIRR